MKIKWTTEKYKQKIKEKVNDEYVVLGEYLGNKTKILMKHNKCGNEYLVTPDKFYSCERRCPFCKVSKGEEKIRKFLKENNIIFSEQYKFEECCDKKPLPFDFYLNDKNILIEFDGEQHFRSSFGPKSYESTTKHDKMKDAFCKNNNIKLIRIKYDKIDQIEEILTNELNLINK